MEEDNSKCIMSQAGISLFISNKNNLPVLEKLFRNLGASANAYGSLNQMLSRQHVGLLHVEALGNKRKNKCFRSNGRKIWSQADGAKRKIHLQSSQGDLEEEWW